MCGSAAVGSARWAGPGPGRAALLRRRGHHHVPATRPTTSACAGWGAEPHPVLPGSLVRRGAGRRASPSGALAGVEDGDGRPARRGSVEVREGCGGLGGSLVDGRQRTGRPPAPSVGPAPARPWARSEQTRHRACVSGAAEEVGRRPPGVRPSPRVPPHAGTETPSPRPLPGDQRGPSRAEAGGPGLPWATWTAGGSGRGRPREPSVREPGLLSRAYVLTQTGAGWCWGQLPTASQPLDSGHTSPVSPGTWPSASPASRLRPQSRELFSLKATALQPGERRGFSASRALPSRPFVRTSTAPCHAGGGGAGLGPASGTEAPQCWPPVSPQAGWALRARPQTRLLGGTLLLMAASLPQSAP